MEYTFPVIKRHRYKYSNYQLHLLGVEALDETTSYTYLWLH